MVNCVEYYLLHGREIKVLDRQLGAVLDVDAQMDLFFVVVLDTQNEAKVQTISISVLLEHVNQVI